MMVAALAGGWSGAGCASARPDRAAISSEDVNERILAIRAAAEDRDKRSVPLLVDRLEDEDDGVRFFTILALERITGQRLGYDYAQSAAQRAAAVERWREFVRHGDNVATPDAPAGNRRGDAGKASALGA